MSRPVKQVKTPRPLGPKEEDYACLRFLDSLMANHKRTDVHMWGKYVGMGYAFVLGNTMDKEEGRPHSRLRLLIERYFVYPPGGLAGINAAYKVMNHV